MTNRSSMRRENPRGFALMVAIILVAVTTAIAAGILGLSGSSKVAAVHASSTTIASAIAETGMARTEALARTVVAGAQDFDRLLDPLLQADCSDINLVTDSGLVAETGAMNLPRFTDGDDVTFNGRRWKRVAYNGGAYLARYDDDNDDAITATATPNWAARTNNNVGAVGSAPFCVEGTAASPGGTSGIDNPARDRNNAIWITVMGIYPGTDPASARHRSVVRKLYVEPRAAAQAKAGMVAKGNLEAEMKPGSTLSMCTEISSVLMDGNVQANNAGVCGCGSQTSDSTAVHHQCATCCGTNTLTKTSTPTTVPAASFAISAAGVVEGKFYDWKSSCILYMKPGDLGGFYFWDATANRGPAGTVCQDYTGNLVPPSTNPDTIGSCWVPVWVDTADAGVVPELFPIAAINATTPATQEIFAAPPIVTWQPRGISVAYDLSGYYLASGIGRTLTGTKPNWATCPDSTATDFRWSDPSAQPGTGTEAPSCAGICDGAHPTVVFSTTQYRFNTAPANRGAWPIGVYFHEGALGWVNEGAAPTTPTTQSPATNWPMFTLIVNGTFTSAAGDVVVLGTGTRKNDFPSLVASTVMVNQGKLYTAGSVFSRGTLEGKGEAPGATMRIFGRMESSAGNIHFEGNTTVEWIYNIDLSLDAAAGTPTVTPHLSMDMSL